MPCCDGLIKLLVIIVCDKCLVLFELSFIWTVNNCYLQLCCVIDLRLLLIGDISTSLVLVKIC